MTRQSQQDPTEFFPSSARHTSVNSTVRHHYVRERRTDDHRPRTLEIGLASAFAAFCGSALGVSLFANSRRGQARRSRH